MSVLLLDIKHSIQQSFSCTKPLIVCRIHMQFKNSHHFQNKLDIFFSNFFKYSDLLSVLINYNIFKSEDHLFCYDKIWRRALAKLDCWLDNQFLLVNSPSPVDFGVLKHIDSRICRPSNLVLSLNYVLTYYCSKHKDSTYRAIISSSIARLHRTSSLSVFPNNRGLFSSLFASSFLYHQPMKIAGHWKNTWTCRITYLVGRQTIRITPFTLN